MGDRPTPAGLRELRHGRKRPHHHDQVPDADRPDSLPPVDAKLRIPADLQTGERRFWRHFAPLLASAKMLTPADEQTLIDYCRACYWVERLTRQLRAEWRKRKQTKHQVVDTNMIKMLDAQARGWLDKKVTLAGELGLTAVARTRTAWTGQQQVIDPKTRPTSKIAELQARSRELRKPLPVASKKKE